MLNRRAMQKTLVVDLGYIGDSTTYSCMGIIRSQLYGSPLNNQDSMESKRVFSWLT